MAFTGLLGTCTTELADLLAYSSSPSSVSETRLNGPHQLSPLWIVLFLTLRFSPRICALVAAGRQNEGEVGGGGGGIPYPSAGSVDINPFGASAPGGGVYGVSNCM